MPVLSPSAKFFLQYSQYVKSLQRLILIHTSFRQTSDQLWKDLHAAGELEYDRFWRLPLDEEFGPQIYSSNADLQNVNAIFILYSLVQILNFI